MGLVPYEMRPPGGLSRLALSDLHWPLGRPPRGQTVADLGPDDHILVHPNTRLHVMPWGKINAKVSLLLAEPDAVHAKHIRMLHLSQHRFHRILTRSPKILARYPQARLFVTGDSFLRQLDQPVSEKRSEVSLIASGKRDLEGHKLRHAVVDQIRAKDVPATIMGSAYAPFEHKEDGLAPFRYSVVIENIRERSMFTEKIIDACLCRTVPLYWGAPDIAEWFDPDGLILCEDVAAFMAALRTLGPDDYARRSDAIEANRQLAMHYAQPAPRAARVLLTDAAETPPFVR